MCFFSMVISRTVTRSIATSEWSFTLAVFGFENDPVLPSFRLNWLTGFKHYPHGGGLQGHLFVVVHNKQKM